MSKSNMPTIKRIITDKNIYFDAALMPDRAVDNPLVDVFVVNM